MKEQKSAKQVKRSQRKEIKKGIAKSLKDVISKNKKDSAKGGKKSGGKFGKKGGKGGDGATPQKPAAAGGNGEKKEKFVKSKSDPGTKPDFKKVVKSNTGAATGSKPEFKKKAKTGEAGGDKEGKKKSFKPKPKVKKPMTPEERKMAKPHYKLVEGLKVNWNKVRDRSTETDVRSSTLVKMVDQFKDHILAVTLRHDASRIVQSVLQFGTVEQKETILASLCAKASEIAKTPYGHFTILKAVTYCTRAVDQRKIVAALKGHFVSLGGNVIGSRTVESVLQLYPHTLTRNLKAEFYGQKFCLLLPEAPRNLHSLIEQLPNKQSAIMDHMRDLVQKFVQKGLLEFAYVHNLLWEYTQEALTDSNAHRMQDLVNQLAESAPKLLSTKPGAKVMCAVITHAAAKDRKRIIKTLKGHVQESLLHDSAYLGIMRLVDVTDDTVNVQKSLFDELKAVSAAVKYTAGGDLIPGALPPLVAIALHRNAHKMLLRLLAPQARHLEPDEEVLFASAGENSKKTPELRRREHLVYLRSALVQVCAMHTEQLMRSRSGSKVLEAVLAVYHPSSVVEAVARVCAGADAVEIEMPEEEYQGEEDEEEGEYDEEEDYEEGENDEEGEGEEGEYDEDEEEGEGEEEVDEEALAEMEHDRQQDKLAAKKAGKSEGAAAAAAPAVEEAPLLAIQEDPVAHLFLKRVLQFEAAAEAKLGLVAGKAKTLLKDAKFTALVEGNHAAEKKAEVAVDDSLWVDKYELSGSDSGPSSVAHRVVELLGENEEVFTAWLGQNRPCFALVKLFSVPSMVGQLNTVLNKARLAALKADADKHEGRKLLLQLQELVKKCK